MIRFSKRSSTLICFLLAFEVIAKPINDEIVFPDGLRNRISVELEDEKEILQPVDDLVSLRFANEADDRLLEYGNFFQGDIVLMDEQAVYLLGAEEANDSLNLSSGRTGRIERWPKDQDGFVRMPIYVSSLSQFSKRTKN